MAQTAGAGIAWRGTAVSPQTNDWMITGTDPNDDWTREALSAANRAWLGSRPRWLSGAATTKPHEARWRSNPA